METFVPALTIFLLALVIGFEVITKVPPLLHTPLMSGANAISGITLVGNTSHCRAAINHLYYCAWVACRGYGYRKCSRRICGDS